MSREISEYGTNVSSSGGYKSPAIFLRRKARSGSRSPVTFAVSGREKIAMENGPAKTRAFCSATLLERGRRGERE